MKKKLLALALVLLLALGAMPARAEGVRISPPPCPANPYGLGEVRLPPRSRAVGEITLDTVTEPTLGGEGVWIAQANGAVEYEFTLCPYDPALYSQQMCFLQKYSASNYFRYTIREPGPYLLFVDAKDSSGSVKTNYFFFEVANVPGVDTISSRVREIVAECRAAVSGEYAMALWLHDWITHNSYYDRTYSNYDADGILFRGTGVCDSYSKLYLRLLTEAGIEAIRVTGTSNNGAGHAWNAAKLEGEWCHIDVTWDDPSGSNNAVSGNERYDYFGLNDAFMSLDHNYTSPVPCNSLANYYIYRSGTHRTWMYHVLSEIEQNLADGLRSFSVDTGGIVVALLHEEGWYYYYDGSTAILKSQIAAALLSMDTWTLEGGQEAEVLFTYDSATSMMSVEVQSIVQKCGDNVYWDYDDGVLIISGQGEMYDYASDAADRPWEDVLGSIVTVVVEDGVTRVGSAAFYGADQLVTADIADSVEAIGENAFSGAPVIICNCDTYARSWADENGHATYLTHGGTEIGEGTPPTCAGPGLTGAGFCVRCGDVLTPSEEIPPLDHEWSEAEYVWAPDYGSVTATMRCAYDHDQTHVNAETAQSAFALATAPTAEAMGKTVYTAAFEGEGFAPQTLVVEDIPALNDMGVLYLPADLTAIEEEAFMNADCQAILIPDGCVSIGSRAFADCESLVYIRIPASVTDMAEDALEGCGLVRVDWPEA